MNEAVEEVRKQTTRGHVYLDLDSCVFVYACKREWIGGHVRMLVYVVYTYTHVACMRACNFVQVSQVLAAALKEDRGERYQQVDQVLAAVQGWRRRYSLYDS